MGKRKDRKLGKRRLVDNLTTNSKRRSQTFRKWELLAKAGSQRSWHLEGDAVQLG